MYLRNIEGAARHAESFRSESTRSTAKTAETAGDTAPAKTAPASRGLFFDMMLDAQVPEPAPVAPKHESVKSNSGSIRTSSAPNSTGRQSSVDENSSAVRGASQTSQTLTATTRTTSPAATTAPAAAPSANITSTTLPIEAATEDPVAVLNGLLTKLGFEPANFNAKVTSAHIDYPGLVYDYPLLEVTVNGERVGFHLPSAMKDPRLTAANIASMMGQPVMSFDAFA